MCVDSTAPTEAPYGSALRERPTGARAPPCDAPPRLAARRRRDICVARSRCRARASRARAAVASLDPLQRAARHAMHMAGTTALQDAMAELDESRREARDTATRTCTRIGDLARARRAAVIAARRRGGMRSTVHVRRVTLLLAGETAPRRARACALPQLLPMRTADLSILSGYFRGGLNPSSPPPINGLCNSRLCRPCLRPLR